MDPDFYELIQQAISSGIATTQVISGVIALFAAAFGAWTGAYFSKRGEFAALKEDFNESLILLRQQTEVVEQTKAEVERLRNDERLAFELQKTRGVERQELRYRSYALLWKELRPLAIYDASIIDRNVVGKLNKSLSDWYFSENGGLLLTPQARYFYFALQNLLRLTSGIAGRWKIDRSKAVEGTEKEILKDVLIRFADDKNKKWPEKPSEVLQYFMDANFKDWTEQAPTKGKVWNEGIQSVAKEWDKLDNEQRFAMLQQVGSILRTSLTNDLESRLG